jgi:hypothetical protein
MTINLCSGSLFLKIICAFLLAATVCAAGNYTNFAVAIYIPVNIVQHLGNPETLQSEWSKITSQVKVGQV